MADGDAATTAATTTTDAATATSTDAAAAASGKTFTQEQVNDLIAREKGNLQRKYEGFDDLKAKAAKFDDLQAANQTDLERVTGERDKHQGDSERAKAENLRLRVALEKKLPPELIDRLRGGTKAEVEADADALLKLVKPADATDFDNGVRTAADGGDMNQMIRQAAGRT